MRSRLEDILANYSRRKLWSKQARKVTGGYLLGLFRVSRLCKKWDKIFDKWYLEFRYIEKHYTLLLRSRDLDPSFEQLITIYEFMLKLVDRLHRVNLIGATEMEQLKAALAESRSFVMPENKLAQEIMLSAFL
jgi:hypothetical protein